MGHVVLIPRICLTLTNTKLPFVLERHQFKVKVCYAMTINRSQGQTLSNAGNYPKKPVFTDACMLLFHMSPQRDLEILIEHMNGEWTHETNIVYHEIFSTLLRARGHT